MGKEKNQKESIATLELYFEKEGYLPKELVSRLWKEYVKHFSPICERIGRKMDDNWFSQILRRESLQAIIQASNVGDIQECTMMVKNAFRAVEAVLVGTDYSMQDAFFAISLVGLKGGKNSPQPNPKLAFLTVIPFSQKAGI